MRFQGLVAIHTAAYHGQGSYVVSVTRYLEFQALSPQALDSQVALGEGHNG